MLTTWLLNLRSLLTLSACHNQHQDTPKFTFNVNNTRNSTECAPESDPYQAKFDNSLFDSTFVTEFYLICDRANLNSYAIQISFVGIFIGAFVGGWTADKFGRKVRYKL